MPSVKEDKRKELKVGKKPIEIDWASSFIEKHKDFLNKEKSTQKKEYLKKWALVEDFPKSGTEEISELIKLAKTDVNISFLSFVHQKCVNS